MFWYRIIVFEFQSGISVFNKFLRILNNLFMIDDIEIREEINLHDCS